VLGLALGLELGL